MGSRENNGGDLRLDERDLSILKSLQADASVSRSELARRLGVSPPALQKRIRRLEELGVFQAEVVILDRRALGMDLLCYVQVSLAQHQPETVNAFREAIHRIPEVLECHAMTGEYDYVLKVVTKGPRELEMLLIEHLNGLPGVDRLRTSIALRELKSTTALPI